MIPIGNVDLTAVPVAELAEIAHAHGIAFHLAPYDPALLIVHPHRDPALNPVVTALRARREEMVAFLVRHRPPSPVVSGEESLYRRVVLGEPNIPLSELTWPILKAMIARTVLEILDAEQVSATERREDNPPVPPKSKRTARRSKVRATDRVVF